MTPLAQAFIAAIENGSLDGDLPAIEQALRAKARGPFGVGLVAPPTFSNVYDNSGGYSPGDRVKLVLIRPKYLVGATGTLVRFKQKRWAFQPDPQYVQKFGRFLDADGTTGVTPTMFIKE